MLQRPRTDTRRRIILGPGQALAATRKRLGKKRTFRQKDGYEYSDWDDPSSACNSIQPKRKVTWKPSRQESLTDPP